MPHNEECALSTTLNRFNLRPRGWGLKSWLQSASGTQYRRGDELVTTCKESDGKQQGSDSSSMRNLQL